MKKKLILMTLTLAMIMLTACGNTLEDTKKSVEAHNKEVKSYKEKAGAYLEASQKIFDGNKKIDALTDKAQKVIDKGEKPFDEKTLTKLKSAMNEAADQQVSDPERLPEYEIISLNQNESQKELKEIKKKAESGIKEISKIEIPKTVPDVPDYAKLEKKLNDTLKAYKDSIQGMKQITAPKDEFVMKRLKNIKTITEMAPVTENNDPNGKLNKQGGYTGCIYFKDTQVDRSKLYVTKDDVIAVGTDGGGAIEIYQSEKEANIRNNYIGGFDSTGFASGSHNVYGTIIIRTSNYLSASQQKKLTQKILDELLKVK